MTLRAYDPKQLDQMALRILDLAATVRQMANRSREFGIVDFPLHDKKAQEWCAHLEQWALKTQADLEVKILQRKTVRRARGARLSS